MANVVPVTELTKHVPGTCNSFWYNRSRNGSIPGQFKLGKYIYVDLDVFWPSVKAHGLPAASSGVAVA